MRIFSCASAQCHSTLSPDYFFQSYGMQYHGQMALQIAILVAFTQLIPEHQVQLFGVLKARVKVIPVMYLYVAPNHIRRRCQWPT